MCEYVKILTHEKAVIKFDFLFRLSLHDQRQSAEYPQEFNSRSSLSCIKEVLMHSVIYGSYWSCALAIVCVSDAQIFKSGV